MNKAKVAAVALTLLLINLSAYGGAEGHGRHGTRGGKMIMSISGGSNIGGVSVAREGTGVGNG